MRLVTLGLVSGLFVSVIVTWWPSSWQYAPGIVFGAAVALYFWKEVWNAERHKAVGFLKLGSFVVLSYLAYFISLTEAEWVLGTNGFATFESYNSSSALAALFVGCFVGGCIGAFTLSLGMRWLLFKFDLVRGLFLFSLFSGALGSIIIIGFEMFGFIPQFLFPAWHVGVMGVILFLHKNRET